MTTDLERPQFSVCKYYSDRTYEYACRRQMVADATEMFVRIINTIDARSGALNRVIMTDGGDLIVAEWKYREGMVYPPKLKGMQLYVRAPEALGSGAVVKGNLNVSTPQPRSDQTLENFPASDARRNGGVLPVRPPPR